jgi:hypothetical protein
VDSESLLQIITLEALIQFQQEIQIVLMLTFPWNKSLQDNLQKCFNNESCAFQRKYIKDSLKMYLHKLQWNFYLE